MHISHIGHTWHVPLRDITCKRFFQTEHAIHTRNTWIIPLRDTTVEQWCSLGTWEYLSCRSHLLRPNSRCFNDICIWFMSCTVDTVHFDISLCIQICTRFRIHDHITHVGRRSHVIRPTPRSIHVYHQGIRVIFIERQIDTGDNDTFEICFGLWRESEWVSSTYCE